MLPMPSEVPHSPSERRRGGDLTVEDVFTLKEPAAPMDDSSMITFEVSPPSDRDVELSIFDVLGRHIRTLVDTRVAPGAYSHTWNGTDDAGRSVSSGIYVYRLEVGGHVATRSITLIRSAHETFPQNTGNR